MINSDKIGKFIAELRENKKLSQEKLGDIIGIGRDSISKWERGINLPSHEMLLKLSDIFEVSVNEILYGERRNKENEENINDISLVLYKNACKQKLFFKLSIVVAVVLIALFGVYYFINSYRSVKVYTIKGECESAFIDNGIFIKTWEKIYFNIDQIFIKSEKKIKNITLYYKNMDNIIYSGDSNSIYISDDYGANEYFEKDYLKDITKNLFLHIEYDDNSLDDIELSFTQDYINDKLFFKEKEKTIIDKSNSELNLLPPDLNYLINSIKKKYKNEENIFAYNKKNKGLDYSSFYIPDFGMIGLVISKENIVIEEWNFYTYGRSMTYNSYKENDLLYSFTYENEKIKCIIGKCEKEQEKIDYFWLYLHETI